jgi:hypothetical protein
MKGARFMAVLAVETSAQEATIVRDSAAIHVKVVEDRATWVEREAQERASRLEVENTTALASGHRDTEGLVWKIILLESELAEVRQAREVVEVNLHGLSDAAAHAEHQREVFEKGIGSTLRSSPFC